MRCVILKPGALGDGLLAAPALARARRRFPAARIEWWGNLSAGRQFVDSGIVDVARSFDDRPVTALFAPDGTAPAARPSETWHGVDLAVVWLSAAGGADTVVRRLASLGAGAVVAAPPIPPAEDISVWSWLQSTLDGVLGATTSPNPLMDRLLTPAPGDATWAAEWLRQRGLPQGHFLTLHPGSGGPSKRWPSAAWGACRRGLPRETPVVLVGGEADAADVAELREIAPDAVPLVGESLGRVAAVLAVAGAHLGLDAGPTHLAGLLGTPTVAVFGPSDPVRWRPWGRVEIARPGGFDGDAWRWSLDPSPVHDALRAVAPELAR